MTDRLIDLVEEGADVAIRNGHLRDSSLVARRICDLRRVICASPAYLKKHGVPKSPQDLLRHNCISISGAPQLRRWPFDTANGIESIDVIGNINANNAETLLQLAANGVGIIRLTDVIVSDGIRAGWLVPLLEDVHHNEPVPLSAVYLPGKHKSPRVAAFVNFLVETFAVGAVAACGRSRESEITQPQTRINHAGRFDGPPRMRCVIYTSITTIFRGARSEAGRSSRAAGTRSGQRAEGR